MRQFYISALTCVFIYIIYWSAAASGMTEISLGNSPVMDQDWPAGSLDVANQANRIACLEGPPFGHCQFEYRGDTAAFNDALAKFARIKASQLLLVVDDGLGSCQFLSDPRTPNADISVDWEFVIWTPTNFYSVYDNPRSIFEAEVPEFRQEIDPPQMNVYLAPGRVDWSAVKVPAGVTVRDERASSNGYKSGEGPIVRGDVYDMLTSKPIAAAQFILERYNDGKFEKVTAATADADGHFEAKQVPVGSYRVVVQSPGYVPRVLGYVKLNAQTLKTFSTRLLRPADFAGNVTDTAGKPIANAKIQLSAVVGLDGRGYSLPDSPTTVTDAQGNFTLAGLPKGYAQIFVIFPGMWQLEILTIYRIPVKDVQMKLTATGKIAGRVLLKENKSAADVNISVRPPGDPVGKWGGDENVNADGTFQFDDVPPGQYWVSTTMIIPDRPIDPNAKSITVTAGQTSKVEISAP